MATLAITRNTLSVHLEQHHLRLVNHDVPEDDEGRCRYIPLQDVDRVVISGTPAVTIPVLQEFMQRGIPVSFLTNHHRWLGALTSDNVGNAKRRIAQYRAAENAEFRLVLASELVQCKIKNCRRVLQRLSSARKESASPNQLAVSQELSALAHKAAMLPESLDELRGYEGQAAAIYFSRLADFFPDDIPFEKRSKHPPLNPANALMSWCYTIAVGEIVAAIKAHGLDPYLGFLHDTSYNMPSLAYDLLEPLRAPLCDMLTMHLLNHRILRTDHFECVADDDGVYLTHAAKREFFPAYEATMEREFTIPSEEQHVTYRKIITNQVMAIIAAIENSAAYQFYLMP
jgi:CRISP-associated protein Cas1